jgi:lipopolysaccharide transport system ATP-binding protein
MGCEPGPHGAIRVQGLGKSYRIYAKPHHRLLEALTRGRRAMYREFRALHDVSFTVASGEVVGILGRNGSGKSTLLQIISGILRPSAGGVETNGRVAALLELGAGFNPEFTGIENVYFYAGILGLSRTEIRERMDEILSFADIGDYVRQPVKTYSSGMYVRLAFAVAACVDPDILIIDEALAVGDVQFQAKCFRRFDALVRAGKTILFVSHSTEQVVRHCTRALLLDGGHLIGDGEPLNIANRYLDLLLGDSRPVARLIEPMHPTAVSFPGAAAPCGTLESRTGYCRSEYRWGSGGAKILDVSLTRAGETVHQIQYRAGETMLIRIEAAFDIACEEPIFGFFIKTPDGITVYGNSTKTMSLPVRLSAAAGQTLCVQLACDLSLGSGSYLLSVGLSVARDSEVMPLDRRYDVLQLEVVNASGAVGLADLHGRYVTTNEDCRTP